jgi:HK97 family phage major capsid protein
MLKRLRQLLADTRAKAEAINKLADTENRLLSEAEQTEFNTLIAECEKIKGQITAQEALVAIERTAPAVAQIEVGVDRATERPFQSLAEQLQAVRAHAVSKGTRTDPRLQAAALGGNESVDSEGGFLVAPEFAPGVWQRTYEASQLASRCFDQPMTASNRLLINAVDEDSRVDGSRWGGIQSFWLGESGTYTASQPKFRQMELIAKKLIALTYATEEQLVDGPAFASYVDKTVPLELAFKVDDAIYNGTGAGQPLGFMNSGALLTIARDAGDSGAVITAKDVEHMWKRRFVASSADLVWLINQDVEDQLWDLTRGSGTAVELLYTGPGQRGNTSNYGVMFGKPVIPVGVCRDPRHARRYRIGEPEPVHPGSSQRRPDGHLHPRAIPDRSAGLPLEAPPGRPARVEEAADPEERQQHAVAVHRRRHPVVARLKPLQRIAAAKPSHTSQRNEEIRNECKRFFEWPSRGMWSTLCLRSISRAARPRRLLIQLSQVMSPSSCRSAHPRPRLAQLRCRPDLQPPRKAPTLPAQPQFRSASTSRKPRVLRMTCWTPAPTARPPGSRRRPTTTSSTSSRSTRTRCLPASRMCSSRWQTPPTPSSPRPSLS